MTGDELEGGRCDSETDFVRAVVVEVYFNFEGIRDIAQGDREVVEWCRGQEGGQRVSAGGWLPVVAIAWVL